LVDKVSETQADLKIEAGVRFLQAVCFFWNSSITLHFISLQSVKWQKSGATKGVKWSFSHYKAHRMKVNERRLELDTLIFPLNILAVSSGFVNKSTHSRHFI
jgi:hypothetical protein